MKKITLLLLALICSVGMWAGTVVTDPATQMVDGTYITLQCMDTKGGDGYYFNGDALKTNAIQTSNFYKIVSNGESAFYLQRVTDSKYVGNTDNAVSMVDDQASAATFTFTIETADDWSTYDNTKYTNGTSTVRLTNGDVYLNTQQHNVTPKYANGKGGYSIWRVTTYTEAEVNAPAFSGNYKIKNKRANKYAAWTGDATQIAEQSTVDLAAVWTITPNGDGSFKVGNKATDKYYASKNSFTAEGVNVYFSASTYEGATGYVNISESSTFDGGTCWDDQDSQTHVGYWNANDEGTCWYFEAVTDADLLTYRYNDALAKANAAYNSLQSKSDNLNTSSCTFDNTCGDSDQGTTPANICDGDASTFWHSDWRGATSENPHWIAIEYPQDLTAGTYQLTVVRRSASSDHVTEFTIYGKNDDDWTQVAVVSVPNATSGATGIAYFDLETSYKSLKYAATGTTDSRTYWHAAEIQLNKVVLNRSFAPNGASALKTKIDAATKTEAYISELNTAISTFYTAVNCGDKTPSIPSDKYLAVGEKANSITAATSGSDNDHWFLMTQVRGGESPMYDAGSGETMKRAAAEVTPASLKNAVATTNTKYLVRFFETASGVYNVQFATGNFVQTTMTTGAFAGAGKYMVYNINNEDSHIGWNLTTDGSTYESIVDNNAAGGTLSFWESGQITTSGGNNDWSVYPVTFTDLSEEDIKTINTQFAALKAANKFDILEGSTVQGPSEFANPKDINAAIAAAQSVEDNVTAKAAFIASENGQKIQKYLDEVAKNGTLANIQFTMNNEYGTLCLPCPATAISGLKMYTCSALEANGTTLNLSENSGNFEHNTPYIIQATKGNKYTIIGWDKGSTATHKAGYLTGVLTEDGVTITDANSYVLATRNSDGVQAFFKTDADGETGTVKCPQYKAYLTVPAGGGVKALYFDNNGEETAITDLQFDNVQGTIGNGKFLENGTIVIVKNGKKFNIAGQRVKY